jgi:hypothetical protein
VSERTIYCKDDRLYYGGPCERDVFLRELVSNASDALDKLRFLTVQNPDIMKDEPTTARRRVNNPQT